MKFEIDVGRCAKRGPADTLGDPGDQVACGVSTAPSAPVKNCWVEADAILVASVA